MPGSINLSKVDISLQQFQEISFGTYNAGEISLAGEKTLGKINNHVGRRGMNSARQSHAEVVAVKTALVNALSANGVAGEELSRIKRELGLAAETARSTLRCASAA